jgi:phosphate transport system protein
VIDTLNRGHYEVLQARMKRDPEAVESGVAWISVSRTIERIADLATNVAEDVVFLVEAEDIRHPSLTQHKEKGRDKSKEKE